MNSNGIVQWAAAEAESHLRPLGDRWLHTVAVAERAKDVSAAADEIDPRILVAAAYAHDLGYAPALHQTGHHGIDGARYLWAAGHQRLAALVAHHSGGPVEAAVRGLEHELSVFVRESSATADALTFCDVTTGHDGRYVTLVERMADVSRRYGEDHQVTRSVRLVFPELATAVARTVWLLNAQGEKALRR